jgi:phosphohistidine phosphatase
MHKTLYLLRHAKALAAEEGMSDEDRPLAPEGEEAAQRLGAYMRVSAIIPDFVLCSPSLRTRQTLELIQPYLPKGIQTEIDKDLYLASSGELFHRVQSLSDQFGAVMLIGHNPGLQNLAELLCDHSEKGLWQEMAMKFPPAALAEIQFKIRHWADVAPGTGTPTEFARPKNLPKDLLALDSNA